MGSAQSARRIQPGGARPAVPAVPADLSRSPFLPTPPPARRSPLPASRRRRPRSPSLRGWGVGGRSGGGRGVWRGRAGGAGGGVGGGPPPGRRPAAAGRTSTVAVRRDRLRDGWEGPAGKVARGGRRHPWAPDHPSPSVTAPRQQRSPNPGAEGAGYPSPRSPPRPLPPPSSSSPEERARVGWSRGAGPPLPRRDRSPAPRRLPLPPSGVRGPGGRGGLSPVRPGRRRAVGPGGAVVTRLSPRSRAHGVGGDVGYPPDPSCNTDQGV